MRKYECDWEWPWDRGGIIVYDHVHSSMWSKCYRTMAGVNFDDVWKVVTDPEFVNNEPENEYDIKVIMRTYKLMKEGVEVLNGPIPLSPEQRNELSTQIGKLRRKLLEESILVNRVNPRVTVYQRNPLSRRNSDDLLNME